MFEAEGTERCDWNMQTEAQNQTPLPRKLALQCSALRVAYSSWLSIISLLQSCYSQPHQSWWNSEWSTTQEMLMVFFSGFLWKWLRSKGINSYDFKENGGFLSAVCVICKNPYLFLLICNSLESTVLTVHVVKMVGFVENCTLWPEPEFWVFCR